MFFAVFALIALILIVAAAGGWFCARLRRRRILLSAIWLPLLIWPYLVWGVIGVAFGGEERMRAFEWWLVGFGYIGLPLLLWTGAAAAGFAVGLLKDTAAGSQATTPPPPQI